MKNKTIIINDLDMLAQKIFNLSTEAENKNEKEELNQIAIIIKIIAKAILNNKHRDLITQQKVGEIAAL